MENILDPAMTYQARITCQLQNSAQLCCCILNFLTEEGHTRIFTESWKFHIGETPVGGILFKLLMHKEVVNTRETATHYH